MKDVDWLFELIGMLLFRFGIELNFDNAPWLYGLAFLGLLLAAFAMYRQKKKRAAQKNAAPEERAGDKAGDKRGA